MFKGIPGYALEKFFNLRTKELCERLDAAEESNRKKRRLTQGEEFITIVKIDLEKEALARLSRC
jgi:hypothetical protein